jgi:hypothetical protein
MVWAGHGSSADPGASICVSKVSYGGVEPTKTELVAAAAATKTWQQH